MVVAHGTEKHFELLAIRFAKTESHYHDCITYSERLTKSTMHHLGPREILWKDIPLPRRDDVSQIARLWKFRVSQDSQWSITCPGVCWEGISNGRQSHE